MRRSGKKERWSGLDAHKPKPWKQTDKCIFCGIEAVNALGSDLTNEHVYSNWTREFVPRDMRLYHSLRSTSHLDRTDFVLVKRAGDLRDWQVTCVCERCNNGWMREKVDEAAKPILTKVIQGLETRLTPADQIKIATWATLKAMVAEFGESENVTTHHTHRKYMWRHQKPPRAGWSVWIAHYVRKKWVPAWVSFPFLTLPDHLVALRPDRRATYYNSQVTTQVVGQLFIQVIRSPMPGLAWPKWKFDLPKDQFLFRIWPPVGTSIVWPIGTITDKTADYIAHAVREFMERCTATPPTRG